MQQAQQAQQMAVKLDLAEKEAKVAKLTAEAQSIQMASLLDKSRAMETFIEGMYKAIQAAGIVVTNPKIAAAADEISRSAGFLDQTPNEQPQQDPNAVPAQVQPAQSAGQGMAAGIETPALGMPQ
jgi:hypothetical protein